jgi:hypothetical protein
VAAHQVGNAVTAERPQLCPHRKAPGAPGQFGNELPGVVL